MHVESLDDDVIPNVKINKFVFERFHANEMDKMQTTVQVWRKYFALNSNSLISKLPISENGKIRYLKSESSSETSL